MTTTEETMMTKISERHSALEKELSTLDDLLGRCRDSQGYGGFSWRDKKSVVTCINRIVDLKIAMAFDAYKHGEIK